MNRIYNSSKTDEIDMDHINYIIRNLVVISCMVPCAYAVINVTLSGTTTRHVCKGEDIDFKWTYDDTDPDKDFIKTIQWSKDPSGYLIMHYETDTSDLQITSSPNDYTGRVERTTEAGTNDIGMRLKQAGTTSVDDEGKYYVSLIVDKPGGDANDYFVPYRDPQGVQVYVCVGVDDMKPIPALNLIYDETTHIITCSGPSTLGNTTFAIFDPSMNVVVDSTTDTTISKDISSDIKTGTYICKTYCTQQGYDDTPQGTCLPTDATLILIVPAWSSWGMWLECTTPGSSRTRTRTCDNPPPGVNGPQSCPGVNSQTEICPTPPPTPPPQPITVPPTVPVTVPPPSKSPAPESALTPSPSPNPTAMPAPVSSLSSLTYILSETTESADATSQPRTGLPPGTLAAITVVCVIIVVFKTFLLVAIFYAVYKVMIDLGCCVIVIECIIAIVIPLAEIFVFAHFYHNHKKCKAFADLRHSGWYFLVCRCPCLKIKGENGKPLSSYRALSTPRIRKISRVDVQPCETKPDMSPNPNAVIKPNKLPPLNHTMTTKGSDQMKNQKNREI